MGKDISYLAIFIGLVVEMMISLALGIFIGVLIALYIQNQNALSHGTAVRDIAHHSTLFLVMCVVLGGLSSISGGFITGWIAKKKRVKNALLMGIISVLLSLLLLLFVGHYPIWYDIASVIFTIAPTTLGGYLAGLLFDRIPQSQN